MARSGTFFEEVETLGEEAAGYLHVAQRVADAHFGPDVTKEIPLLVTQTAQLMASLAARTEREND
ncbi:hypothetical protein EV663_102125 [Rhodovulum bhavnagarense]|uniref:Uncharacterized protein n=1 Tax=Rhodovulum bhavnagarense TaxID=992286 RepID=A0A4R2RR03_9RHOB|nr:hypothetical protein [Rhodovulum bhavnagarense]TCP62281.1 hypothetical protein EV663_102125 [Rhodovulum bhavnagarense]